MQDLADELGVSESRISQLRAEALLLLKDGINSQLEPDAVAGRGAPERSGRAPQGRVLRGRRGRFDARATACRSARSSTTQMRRHLERLKRVRRSARNSSDSAVRSPTTDPVPAESRRSALRSPRELGEQVTEEKRQCASIRTSWRSTPIAISTTTNDMLGKSLEKLSSGYRINRAADDASGLVISQNLDKQVSGLRQATQNAQDGISVVQTAEGALTQVNSMLNRMHDLIVQAANTASSDSTARTRRRTKSCSSATKSTASVTRRRSATRTCSTAASVPRPASSRRRRPASTRGVTVDGATADVQLQPAPRRRATPTARSIATVTVDAGTYATAASFQAELQADVDAADDRFAGFTGAVTVKVTDLGSRRLDHRTSSATAPTPAPASRSAASGTDLARRITASGCGRGRNTGGGVFQVGANVTGDQPDPRVDRRRAHHQRDERHVHRAGATSTSPTRRRTRSRRRSSTTPSRRFRRSEASSVRTRTGSSRPSPTCRSPRKTSPLRRAASVTPTWRPKWSTSPATRSCSRPVRPCSPRRTRRRRPS